MTEMTETSQVGGNGHAVYSSPAEEALSRLKKQFPGSVVDDAREGYEGVIVAQDQLLEVAQLLRDELGFNFLSSVTGVDLIDENKMEAVYHTYSISNGGGALVFKVQVERDNPVIPSLTPLWPAA
jgi:NADH-quinone oxidoreductase subunit C/D